MGDEYLAGAFERCRTDNSGQIIFQNDTHLTINGKAGNSTTYYGRTIYMENANQLGIVSNKSANVTLVSNGRIVTVNGSSINGNNIGIFVTNGSTAKSSGRIEMNGTSNIGMSAQTGSTASNINLIVINGTRGVGILAKDSNTTGSNYGRIVAYATNACAMYANNSAAAAIIVNATSAHGMHADGTSSLAINCGTITINNYGSFVLLTETNATATNNGNSYGMSAMTNATAKNYSNITIYGDNSYGILRVDSCGTIYNAAIGTIETWENNSHGMCFVATYDIELNGTIITNAAAHMAHI